MSVTPEDQLKHLMQSNLECTHSSETKDQFRSWFVSQFTFKRDNEGCSLSDFAVYFLNAVRQHTEVHQRYIESEVATNVGNLASDSRSYNAATSTPKRNISMQHSTPSTSAHISTTELNDKSIECIDDSLLNRSNIKSLSSVILNSQNQSNEPNTSRSFQSEHSTSFRHTRGSASANQNNSRRSAGSFNNSMPKSVEKQTRNNTPSSSFCLGDFIVYQSGNNRSNRKKTQQSHAHEASIDNTPTSKPSRRVVPTTIAKRTNISGSIEPKPFGSSSFSNENNILPISISTVEIEDRDKCSIMAARKHLKLNSEELSKELNVSKSNDVENKTAEIFDRNLAIVPNVTNKEMESANLVIKMPLVDFEAIDQRSSLDRLVAIYNVLIELNFITNILSELAFLLNLLNVLLEGSNSTATTQDESSELNLLENVTNCIYFCLRVLQAQWHLLALLDSKSLGVVLKNERIWSLDSDLKTFVESIHQRKQLLEAEKCHATDFSLNFEKSFKSVYYQEDKDSRQNFTCNNEFGAFKTQRDLFYKSLKLWDTHHLKPTWNFSHELTSKIREIFEQSENPINMAHFAKLFVSQLLISANDATSPEEMGLDVDAQKFNKLAQRLVAPSNFSVDYQFPRNQAFFRDFICEARSIPFIEQLKLALYSQLNSLNDSTFEQLNVPVVNDKNSDELQSEAIQYEHKEFIVRPEVLASMIMLAKFLGFVTAQPYSQINHNKMPVSIEKKQVALRSLFQPQFNICKHLKDAIKMNKIIITVPWLVQYLVMLDNVTLQLEGIVEATQLLFALYMRLGAVAGLTTLSPTSIFILRCCLGWLFDNKPLVAEQYFTYRATHIGKFMLFPKEVATALHINSPRCGMLGSTLSHEQSPCTLKGKEILKEGICEGGNLSVARNRSNYIEEQLNPMLESLLSVACPFMAEFRVSIMPTKHATTKNMSRSGRYRHVTTLLASIPATPLNSPAHNSIINAPTDVQKLQQNKLIEVFLHSQNASMRRLIDFVTDRVYKSVVKDGHTQFVVPLKVAADKDVNGITSCDKEKVYASVKSIYEKAHYTAQKQWQINTTGMLEERISKALTALLPAETAPIMRQTYFFLIRRSVTQKVHQWYQGNLAVTTHFYSDLNDVTQKICKANEKILQIPSDSELKITNLEPSVSDMIDELQYWLHCTSLRNELLTTSEAMITFLKGLPTVFTNTLPTMFYRLMGVGVVQLLQNIIVRKPEYMTAELITAACRVWTQPEMQNAVKISKLDSPTNEGNLIEEQINSESSNFMKNISNSTIYDNLINVTFIEALSTYRMRYDKLCDLLITMIQQCVLSVEKVNVLFVPIFKENWPSKVLNEISRLLQNIASSTASVQSKNDDDSDISNADEAKSHLFMEVLADFSRDVDDF